jgi:tRNA1(Val) A37 N6-methylase TrmN6
LKIEKPFVVYNEDNSYAEEYSTITEEVLKWDKLVMMILLHCI